MRLSGPGIIIGVLALICQGCIYMEPETYFVDPVPSDPPTYIVCTNLDTIQAPSVSDSLEVSYLMELENGKFYLADAYLSSGQIYRSDSAHGSFMLYPYHAYSPGIDTLYINFYISSNTNSLADVFELEANLVQLKYGVLFEVPAKK